MQGRNSGLKDKTCSIGEKMKRKYVITGIGIVTSVCLLLGGIIILLFVLHAVYFKNRKVVENKD